MLTDEDIWGPIAPLLKDESVTEIMINDFDRIYIEKAGRFVSCGESFSSCHLYARFVRKILQLIDKTADRRVPLVDGVLPSGVRVHIALPPVTQHPVVTLRTHTRSTITFECLVRAQAIRQSWVQPLRQKLHSRVNMLVCGATGAGKTTLIRALLNELPDTERILTIEDTPELNLPGANCVSLVSRQVPDDLAPPITLTDLVRNALRMRPERLIVGEIRGEESLAFLDAVSTGHRGALSAIHGGNPREALHRLESLVSRAAPHWPLETIRSLIFQSVKLVVCISQVIDEHGEKTREITEISELSAIESFGYLLSPWR